MTFGLNASDTLGPLADGDMRGSFVPVDEAAQRMNLTVEQVQQLVRRGVLRADRGGNVQPAILSGAVDT